MSAPEPLSAERRAELRAWIASTASMLHALIDQADEAARLAGEVERLRAALKTIADQYRCRITTRSLYLWTDDYMAEVARAALTPPEPSGGEG